MRLPQCSFVASAQLNLPSCESRLNSASAVLLRTASRRIASRIEIVSQSRVPEPGIGRNCRESSALPSGPAIRPRLCRVAAPIRVGTRFQPTWRGSSTYSREVLAKSISELSAYDGSPEQQCRHAQTTVRLAAKTGVSSAFCCSAVARMVGWRVPRTFFGGQEDLLLRLRYEGWHSHVHAHVRASQVREPLLGQFVPEEKTRS